MFNNIGGKIKTLAKVLCWIGIIASIIFGLAMIVVGNGRSYNASGPVALLGVLYMVLGSLFSWIGSFFAYGFGQLIEDTEEIRENTRPKE